MGVPITHQLLSALFQSFNLSFNKGFKAQPTWWQYVAMQVPSDTEEEVYAWLAQMPGVREWIGERKAARLAANGYRLKNKDWEQTLAVERNKIEDDKVALFGNLFDLLGREKAKHPDRQIAKLLINGADSVLGLCWDGQAFFSTGHPVDPNAEGTSPTFDNRFTSTALTPDNFELVYATMSAIKDANGNAMTVMPDTLFVAPKKRATALRIVSAGVQAVTQGSGAAAIDNVNQGLVKVVVVPELATAVGGNDDTWYLGQCEGPIKPLIRQMRADHGFQARTDPTSDNVFNKKTYEYGGDTREAFGYSLPQLLCRCEA